MSAFEEQELKKLANALAALTPRPAHLDRDGILFEAGRRSARPAGYWPWTTAGMTVVAGVLGLALALRSNPPTVVQFVEVPRKSQPVPAPTADVIQEPAVMAFEFDEVTLPPGSYWRLQQGALRNGVESLQGTRVEPPSRPLPGDPIPSVGKRGVLTTILLTGDN